MIVLAVDPGAITGYAAIAQTPRGLVLEHAGAIQYRSDSGISAAMEVWDAIRATKPNIIAVEDWEQQGQRVDMHSSWPNRVIGQVEAYAGLLGIHLCYVGASTWKPSFARNAGALPPPPIKLPRSCDLVARRLALELGVWPQLLSELAQRKNGHSRRSKPLIDDVIHAAGLACWVALHPRVHGVC